MSNRPLRQNPTLTQSKPSRLSSCKLPKMNKLLRVVSQLALAGLFSIPVIAQIDSNLSENDTTVQLSPFVIEADAETGYRAKSSLTGGRVNMNLDDISVPMDVITPELMEDFNLVQQEDLFNIASNMESRGDNFLSGVYESGASYSIRGFVGVRSLRNFTVVAMPFDRYSSGSVTVSKGPNAILYGSGPGGGSISFFTKRYRLGSRDRRNVSLTFDSEGSTRGEISIDQVLIDNKLGFNFSAFRDKKEFYIKPAYEDRRGYYFTAAFQPFEGTLINASYETRTEEVFRAASDYTTLTDYNTAWTGFGEPTVLNPSLTNNTASLLLNGATISGNVGNYGLARQSAAAYTLIDGKVINIQNSAYTDRPSTGNSPQGQRSIPQYLSAESWPITSNPTGLNGGADVENEVFDLTLEQKITSDFYLNAAFSKSDNDRLQHQHRLRELYRDPNQFQPGSAGTVVNPHYGEYYVQLSNQNYIDKSYDTEAFSVMATYQLDLEKHNRFFGKHMFAAMYQELEEEFNNVRQSFRLVTNPTNPNYTLTDVQTAPTLNIREYLGTDISQGGSMADYRSLQKQGFYELDGYRWELFDGVGGTNWNRTTTTSKMVVAQSSWLRDRIITSFGYRPESVSQYIVNFANNPAVNNAQAAYEHYTKAQSEDPTFVRVLTDEIRPSSYPTIPWQTVTGISRNVGIIAKVTPNFALVANKSQNISGSAGRVGVFGAPLPNSDARSTDYGFRLNLFEQKIRMEYTRYETDVTNNAIQATGGSIRVPYEQARDLWETMIANGSGKQNVFLNSENWDTRDFVATGDEVTITGDPMRGLNLRLAVSRNVKVADNQGGTFMPWWEANKADIEAFAKANPDARNPLDTDTTPDTAAEHWTNAQNMLRLRNDLVGQEEINVPIWTAKLVTKYAFQEGVMKGHQTGFNVAWRGKQKSNYFRLADDSSDLSDPFWTDDTTHVSVFWNYSKRLGDRLTWKLQVNVSNVFNTDTTLYTNFFNTVDGDKNSAVINTGLRRFDPRIFSITNSFSF